MEVRLYRNAVFHDLQQYGSFGTFEWKIPLEVLSGTTEIKMEWLKAFFDSEATVQVSPPKIILYSANLIGLHQVQQLLHEFSIIGRINGPYAGAYRLTLECSQLPLFFKHLNFYHSLKSQKLACIIRTK
ncbi:LAGLIDADG family homing endonuclease [Candidatus Woesearchaeota archaeon]|nr:LAGLIDADG family homing endonuclease [Candidatus Woesearchaeota archaeon]